MAKRLQARRKDHVRGLTRARLVRGTARRVPWLARGGDRGRGTRHHLAGVGAIQYGPPDCAAPERACVVSLASSFGVDVVHEQKVARAEALRLRAGDRTTSIPAARPALHPLRVGDGPLLPVTRLGKADRKAVVC